MGEKFEILKGNITDIGNEKKTFQRKWKFLINGVAEIWPQGA